MESSEGGCLPVSCYQETVDGLVLLVRVQPGASRNAIGEVVEGRLRVRLTAPPVDGAANSALVVCLALWLDVPRGRVAIVGGARAREKRVLVLGDAGSLRLRLEALLRR
jgi:uncharacterized protein (TIGR00251 family)